jgi:hypothetical protein
MFEHKGLVTATYVLLPYLAFESDVSCYDNALQYLTRPLDSWPFYSAFTFCIRTSAEWGPDRDLDWSERSQLAGPMSSNEPTLVFESCT